MNDEVKFKQPCTLCSLEYWNDELEFLPIYTIGSEGTYVCEPCKMAITEFCRSLMSASSRGQRHMIRDVNKMLDSAQGRALDRLLNEEREAH
jgi:hypothetical protein